MLIPKEVARPGTYWYRDQKTGDPRKLTVTKEMLRHWHDSGNAMRAANLPIPVPIEHNFDAHPMSAVEALIGNAGWVEGYEFKTLRDKAGKEVEALFATVDVQDEELVKKLPRTVRWTSPWINSFVDGSGKQWNNVISHLALTTRPRIVDQEPFGSVVAALSVATETEPGDVGYCISQAGLLYKNRPQYPVAFSMYSGIAFAEDDTDFDDLPDELPEETPAASAAPAAPAPVAPVTKDIGMEELLCDLLQALGVPMPDESNEAEFHRHLYEAVMSKIKELTSKGMGGQSPPDQNKPPTQQPNASQPKPNPLIDQVQQETPPMYMSLDDINKIEDTTMRSFALSMHAENEALRARLTATEQKTNAMEAAKLEEAAKRRRDRIKMLGKLAPKVREDLEAQLSLQSMALSMGEGGVIIDPMKTTLDMLEKGLQDLPRMLTVEAASMSVAAHPTDADALSAEGEQKLVDDLSRMMGCTAAESAA